MNRADSPLLHDLKPEQLLRYMPHVQQQRQELRLVEAAWDNLALLSSLSRLSSKASASNDLGRARHDFAALSAEMMQGLGIEALNNVLHDLQTQAQTCIDIVVRNLFERSADIGFFATDATITDYLVDPQEARRPTIEQHLQAYASKYTVYRNILLLDLQGHCLARLRPGTQASTAAQAEPAWMAQVLAQPLAYVQDHAVHGLCDPARPTLVYAQAVLHQHAACGVLCLEFDLHDEAQALFTSVLNEGSGARDGARPVLALVDPAGQVVDSSDALQLPAGWHLPAASAAGTFALQHMGRRYVAVACDTTGFQGYRGLGWRGLALIPLDLAFEDSVEEESALMQEATGNAELLPGALRQIPQRSAAIQSALERSVWNGLLELNQAPSDASDAQQRDVVFAKTLLSEIGVTAQKTAQAFSIALRDLHKVVMASALRDTQSRTSLAMQILDRNLYERANDCRWWAQTPQFADTLAAGTLHCPQATHTLQAINALYTVYNCLVLFDKQGRVLAVSNDHYADQVGQVLDEPWVAATLRLGDSQQYAVSALEPSRFYPQAPTYIYAAAVRAPSADTALGGIAVVWDAAGQMQSILADCAAGLSPQDALVLLDAQGALVQGHGSLLADMAPVHQDLHAQEPIVALGEHLHGLGHAHGPGYREFGTPQGYRHGLRCLALRYLGQRQARVPQVGDVQSKLHLASGAASQPVQLATFSQGAYWLGLDSRLIQMAAPDGKLLAAANMPSPFCGMVHIQNKVYPVLDLRQVVADQAEAGAPGEGARQLIVLQVPLENGTRAEFALRVDRLGAMLDLDRQQLQAINMPHNAGPSMIDAVVRFDGTAGYTSNVLCQLSRLWLQYCVGNLKGEFSAHDLGQFVA
ncbi:MAG: chemotaxis protein CheW [Rhodoferax sp.]